MKFSDDLPLMQNLPKASVPGGKRLVLASGSPRRRQLLSAAGYQFEVDPAGPQAECGVCSRETAPQLVARFAYRKALDVIKRRDNCLVLAADTVASCNGRILGKPADADHAREMLQMLSGRQHDVYSGVCLWSVPDFSCLVDVQRTELVMSELSPAMLEEYIKSMLWEGKAGAFGYQDGNDWLRIIGDGSESNVVGLPMERLAELLEKFDQLAETITVDTSDKDLPTTH